CVMSANFRFLAKLRRFWIAFPLLFSAKPNVSFKPLCVSGPMSATTPTPKNAISNSPPGSTTTISPALMVASVTLHPSAALLPKVQPLEGSQLPLPAQANCWHYVTRLKCLHKPLLARFQELALEFSPA